MMGCFRDVNPRPWHGLELWRTNFIRVAPRKVARSGTGASSGLPTKRELPAPLRR